MESNEVLISGCLQSYSDNKFELKQFLRAVETFFEEHPDLNKKPFPPIHSTKSRFKDDSHVAEKLERKIKAGKDINIDNFFSEVTDLIGIRVLHLHQEQFIEIHSAIVKKVM